MMAARPTPWGVMVSQASLATGKEGEQKGSRVQEQRCLRGGKVGEDVKYERKRWGKAEGRVESARG